MNRCGELMGSVWTGARSGTPRRTCVQAPRADVEKAMEGKIVENPIGRHFGPAPRKNDGAYEVAGVAADVRYVPSQAPTPAVPMYFLAEAQSTTFDDLELQGREVWSH